MLEFKELSDCLKDTEYSYVCQFVMSERTLQIFRNNEFLVLSKLTLREESNFGTALGVRKTLKSCFRGLTRASYLLDLQIYIIYNIRRMLSNKYIC